MLSALVRRFRRNTVCRLGLHDPDAKDICPNCNHVLNETRDEYMIHRERQEWYQARLLEPVTPQTTIIHRGHLFRVENDRVWVQDKRGEWLSAGWRSIDECERWIKRHGLR